MTARQPNLIDGLMAEVIVLGGFPVTRADAHAWLKADGHGFRECDYFAFAPAAVDRAPMSLAQVRASIAEAESATA